MGCHRASFITIPWFISLFRVFIFFVNLGETVHDLFSAEPAVVQLATNLLGVTKRKRPTELLVNKMSTATSRSLSLSCLVHFFQSRAAPVAICFSGSPTEFFS